MTETLTAANAATAGKPSKFLTQLVEAATRHGHTQAAAQEMAEWSRRFILFHAKQHPQEMGRTEVGVYLEHVARTEKDALRGQEKVSGPFSRRKGVRTQ